MTLMSVAAAKQASTKVSVRRFLHRNLAGMVPARTLRTVHASAVTQQDPTRRFCPREYALYDIVSPGQEQEFLPTCLAVTFRIGRDVESHVQEVLARSGALVGDWGCPHCNAHYEFCKRPHRCLKCGHRGDGLLYEEVRFTSKLSGISCGIDALFDEGTGKHRVLESKSIDKDECKTLAAPLAEHRLRMSLYLRIIAESDSPHADKIHTDEGVVLYTSKGGYGFADPEVKTWGFPDQGYSPFKEYRVVRNDALTDGVVAHAKIVRDWRETHYALEATGSPGVPELPPRICKTSLDARARNCRRCGECFQHKDQDHG